MPIMTSEPDLRERDGGRARRRATARAVAVRVLVAALAFTLIEVVCSLAGWDSGNWSVTAGFATSAGYDRLLSARRARRAAGLDAPHVEDAPGR